MFRVFGLLIGVLLLVSLLAIGCTFCGPYRYYWEHVSPYTFDVSPSGQHVAFTANGKGGRDLYILDLRTNKIRAVTRSFGFEREVRFLSDSELIVATVTSPSRPWSTIHLYLIDVFGRRKQQVTRGSDVQDGRVVPVSSTEILFDRAEMEKGLLRILDIGGGLTGVYLADLEAPTIRRVFEPLPYYDVAAVFRDKKRVVIEGQYGHPNLKILVFDKPLTEGGARVIRREKLVDKGYSAALASDEGVVFYVEEDSGIWRIISKRLGDSNKKVVIARNRLILSLRATKTGIFFLEGSDSHLSLWRLDTHSKKLERLLSPAQFANPLRR